LPVLGKLLNPEIQTGFWLSSATRMPMPEASVNENNLAQSRKNHIRSSRKIAYMKSVTESHAVYEAAHNHLWPSVLAFDAGHPFTAFLFGEIIHGI